MGGACDFVTVISPFDVVILLIALSDGEWCTGLVRFLLICIWPGPPLLLMPLMTLQLLLLLPLLALPLLALPLLPVHGGRLGEMVRFIWGDFSNTAAKVLLLGGREEADCCC